MTPVRKLTFQLASLIDLLLIVMFAQYLEVQIVAQDQAQQRESERKSESKSLESLREQLAELQRQLAQLEQQQRSSDQAENSRHEELGQLLAELFRIPEETIQRIAKRRSQDEAGLSPAEVAALVREFRTLAQSRGNQVVDYLLTFAEMRKRFDVWELYLQENGALQVRAASHEKRVQTGVIQTPEQFSDELFKLYKSFPQTKSVVLILVSYGDSRLSHRLAVIKGLPQVAERMRADSNGSARFEYAVLGYRPESPPAR